MTTSYIAGTVSVSAGSRTVTGDATNWVLANISPGYFGLTSGIGPVGPVEEIVSDNEFTLVVPWSGPTLTDQEYWLSYDTRDGQQTVNNATRLAEYIARLDSESLSAIAALDPASDTLIMFTGSSTATLIPVGQLGGLFDVQVPDLAARAAYDASPAGFKVLVSDTGDGIAALYSKKTAASGDWTEPAYVTGAQGEAGPSGPFTQIQAGTTTTLPAGSQATVSVVPVSEGVIRLDFGLPQGMDGTGTGDVVGPNGGVTAKQVAGFSSTTGKAIVGLTPAEVRLAADAGILSGFRNKLINGGMSNAQRGAVTVPAGGSAYTLDRWLIVNTTNQPCTVSSVGFTAGSVVGVIPGEPTNALSISFNTAPTSGVVAVTQKIEGVNTLAGKMATLRGYIAAIPGETPISVNMSQVFGSGGSPSPNVDLNPIEISHTSILNGYRRIDALFSIPNLVGKTRGTSADCLQPRWIITPRQAGLYLVARASLVEGDCRSEVDTFSERHPQQELELCQRYYQVLYLIVGTAGINNNNAAINQTAIPVRMRATPSQVITFDSGTGATFSLNPLLSGIRQDAPHSGLATANIRLDSEL